MRIIALLLMALLLAACGSPEETPTEVPAAPIVFDAATETPADTGAAVVTPTEAVNSAVVTVVPTEIPATTAEPQATVPPQPTLAPAPTEADRPTNIEPVITLDPLAPGTSFNGVATVSGVASITPFEKNLVGQVRDGEGNVLGEVGIMTEGEYGEPAYFTAEIPFTAPASTRPGKVVIIDYSEQDGSIFAIGAADVTLEGYAGSEPRIFLPAPRQTVTLPLHVEVGGLQPGLDFTAQLTYADGTILEQTGTALEGGWLVMNLDWATESQPPMPETQPATLQILYDGNVTLEQDVTVAARDDANWIQSVQVYFYLDANLQEVTRNVPRTSAVGAATLRELSWGPAGNEVIAAGMTSMLPSPERIAAYPGRQADWSGRVFLRSIRIENGIAYVDWSREMAAWGGGSAALGQLQQQVRETLTQNPNIRDVVMTVEGSEEVLQP